MNKKVLLMILDGWGITSNSSVSAIAKAKTPYLDRLFAKYPHTTLNASGLDVGLPDGQMGNSEVGHMNLGAGRVVYQNLARIHKAIADRTLDQNPVLKHALNDTFARGTALHLMGLVSDGGVHSHIDHLKALCTMAVRAGLTKIFIHAFTDGRDTDPKSGLGYISDLQNFIEENKLPIKIATIIGRYYGMDRDKRWDRIRIAYDALVSGKATRATSATQAIKDSYAANITDEFVLPVILTDQNGQDFNRIAPNDTVLCFNFRTDRCREITQVLTQKSMPEHHMFTLPLRYITLTNYSSSFKNVEVVFEDQDLNLTLGEVIASHGKKQIRIAETEKYPHVTYFFSGGQEAPFEGEKRIMIQSPRVATFDLKPEMGAYEITEAILPEICKGEADFICLNFANPDMVGHTGVFEAVVKACETVDACASRVIESALAHQYAVIVLADHGNADFMINPDGSPNTAHSTSPVPFLLASNLPSVHLKQGKLGDVAPTILSLMGLSIPEVMTGNVLAQLAVSVAS
ncbi:MAG: 2,3-bisphosphoglycerate-independent phosphoglycerate mutase [Cytophagales bacterium]|nr:MAG: 2,3-bisphosphoglycerate-independent phosphoglycerate mutase [Cytophagales bacterium]TAF60507.1 MAG: 2,3-bisphosphoglycerate-independent phosphoglycerate mutase [Cytophagales bacterium]